jgi:hypothetical protein
VRVRLGVIASTFVIGAAFATATPASAAKAPDPCKLLKASEIQDQFGASVSAPKKGLKTAANVSCTWDVDASAARPDGSVTTTIMFVNGDVAYDGLKKEQGFEPASEFPKALYQPLTGALMVLKGKTLVTVQGVFLSTSPIARMDVKPQLVPLAKIAVKRA